MVCRSFNLCELRARRAVPRNEVYEVQPSCVVPNGETSPALAYRMYSKGESLPYHRGVFNADDGFDEIGYPKSQAELMSRRKEFIDRLVHSSIETDLAPSLASADPSEPPSSK